MRIKLPRSMASFNRRVNNPLQRSYAWVLPPWVIICHRGRRTGRRYRTPVNAYKRGRTLAVVILYGAESDWVRNVLQGDGQVVRRGRTYDLIDAKVVDPADAVDVSCVARVTGRLTGKLLVATLGDAHPGFGLGPQAD